MEPTIHELFDLSGKVAMVTGGAGFLGTSIARALAEAGASVVISSRELSRSQEAAAALPKAKGAKHYGVELDQMDADSIEKGFNAAVKAAGKIDILVNNAHEILAKDWSTVTAEQFNRQLANQTGYFLLARHVRNNAVERKAAASIIMVGSMYGVVGSYPELYEGQTAISVAYHALKGGIVQMTRHLAVFWASDNVRVNCMSPGPFLNVPEPFASRYCKKSPMKRLGNPKELKGVVVLLASDAGGYMTGQNILVDGGWTAW